MSVIFDQLRISDDASKMYINVHVNDASYFDDVYLKSITIVTAENVSENDPSSPSSSYIYKALFDGTTKEEDLVLTKADFDEAYTNWITAESQGLTEDEALDNGTVGIVDFSSSAFNSDLFFVYIEVEGEPDECTPCELDKQYTLGIVFDDRQLYQKALSYTKELINSCQPSNNFIDFILQWNAFKAAVETGHYTTAIKFYNMMFNNIDTTTVISKCNCNG